jgi:queuine tRNA-ribosyltransferase
MFDSVYPTRSGRNCRAMTRERHFNVFNAEFVTDFAPLDGACDCFVCRTFSRAYLAHLFRAKEMLGPRLLSYHNVYLLNALMAEAREAIETGTWHALRARIASAQRTDPRV